MKHPCQAFVKNRKLLAKIPCGRSGRDSIVRGQSFEVRLVLCGRHRKVEARRFEVFVVRKTYQGTGDLCVADRLPVNQTAADFLEGV